MVAYRPGTSVISRSTPPPRGIFVDSGVWFVVGAAEKGSVLAPQLVRSMAEFQRFYGARQSYSLLSDSLETFFREGGSQAYVSRVVGSAAATASVTLNDSAGTPAPSIKVNASSPGVWGNSLSAAVVAGAAGGEFVVVITHSTLGEVDRSISLVDQAAAINWSLKSDWVRITLPGSAGTNDPAVVGATALTGGVDDNSGILDADRVTALNRISSDYGTGQVSVPGNTSSTVRTALIAHARANNREALLDATDTPSRSALVTEGNGLQGDEYGSLYAPWCVIPGVRAGTTRTVPPCALVAGLMARSDAGSGPNVPAAGDNGRTQYVLGLSQPAWSDSDRDLLNKAGVNLIRQRPDGIVLYGYRTLANPNVDVSWIELSNQRLRNEITAKLQQVAEHFMFDQIDGRGMKIAEFRGALTGVLLPYYSAGSLFGEKPDDAFRIDVGSSVNTPDTLAAGELHAVIGLRMSPFAEFVQIEIAKVSVAEAL